jgi:hypothetical protein
MSEPRPLHRLFELAWTDFFEGTAVRVEPETDLSRKQQFLDLAFVRDKPEPIPRPLPDGFEDLSGHNPVTFKSHQEALDCEAVWELVSHFVNYRKQVSPSMQELLPRVDFRLFAVCARYPQQLANEVPLTRVRDGVYDLHGIGLRIRIIVIGQLPQEEQNAMLHLFSAREELLRYGREHYRPYSGETSSLLFQLFQAYKEEPNVSEALKELYRQTVEEILASTPPEDLCKRLTPEERVKGLPAEERLKGLSAEEVIKGLPPETLEALVRQLKANGPSSKPQGTSEPTP